jgi:hypothetical protein
MERNINSNSPAFTSREYAPSLFAVVPVVVPLRYTLTKGTGCPLSSVIFPEMLAAKVWMEKRKMKRERMVFTAANVFKNDQRPQTTDRCHRSVVCGRNKISLKKTFYGQTSLPPAC